MLIERLEKKGFLLLANKLIKKIPDSRKTVRKGEKVDSNISIYSDTKKCKFLNAKNVKTTKRAHAFKGYASTYNAEILNSFKHELQLSMSLQLKVS